MGGNALKNQGARRVSAQEAKVISAKICHAIDSILANHGFARKSHCIEAYRSKPDFGDLDILVVEEAVRKIGITELANLLEMELGVSMPFYLHHPNASNFSVGYPLGDGTCVQVDIIYVQEIEFEFACKYFAFNDLGNLITILTRRMDKLKFGHSGLSAVFKEGGHPLGIVYFTRDYHKALTFLGYDANRFDQGFNTLEEIYEFAASSPFMNPDVFLVENRNHDARMRDRKRSTFNGFLKWMKERDLPRYQWPENGEWIEKAMAAFPEAVTQIHTMSKQESDRKAVKAVFNGSIVNAITNLEGNALGLFMEAFKKYAGEDAFFDYILSKTSDELKTKITDFYNSYSKSSPPLNSV